MALQAKLLSYCFSKSYLGYETFQNVAPILHSAIFSEINTLQLQTKGCCKKERGSYKFMFSLETVTSYCKIIFQLTI